MVAFRWATYFLPDFPLTTQPQ